MSFDKYTNAMENMFDPEATVTTLLDSVRENVKTTVKTVDQAAQLENKLSEEAAQFNNCLLTMSNAIRKCERGEISKEEALSDCAPCVAALKNKCVALTLSNAKIVGDDITEDEIAMLREYITGCKDIVADRKVELQDCSCASESFIEDDEIAVESALGRSIRQSTDAKTANECYKQAKKLYGVGSKEEAKKYLAKAKKLYEKCLANAKKHGKMTEVKSTVSKTKDRRAFTGGKKITSQSEEKTESKSMVKGIGKVIKYFEDRIDSCTALQMQWDNKAGKSTFKETKAQLKAERASAKRQNDFNKYASRAGKTAASGMNKRAEQAAKAKYKEMRKAAAESWEEYEMIDASFELMDAMEAFADEVLMDCEIMTAMEAEGEEEGKSEAEQKLEDLYTEFRQAKANKDEAEMERIINEMTAINEKVSKEAADAYTEEDYAAAKRKRKKCIAIGAAVAAAIAAIAGFKTGTFQSLGSRAKAAVEKLKKDKTGATKNETESVNKNLWSAIKSGAGKIRGKFPNRKGKGGKEPAPEGYINDMTFEEFEESMEAFMDALEMDLAMEAAMEAEGEDEGSATKASGIGSKIRGAFAKLKRGKKNDNQSEVNEAIAEINEATDELEDAADAAETPEEKKKLGKAAKIGIAAAATVLAFVGIKKGAEAASRYVEKLNTQYVNGNDIKGAKNLIRKAGNSIKSVDIKKSMQTAKERSAKKKEIKDAFVKIPKMQEKMKKKFKKGNESFLSDLAFGLEGVMVDDEDVDDDEFDELEGKAFDDEGMSEEATEAAIAVMMAEDGIDDSDLEFMF